VLSLDSEVWTRLRTAYGDGREVPALLRRVASEGVPLGYTNDSSGCPWAVLWATICHQGTVYTASYAAVPHLVRLCSEVAPVARPHVVQLVVWIEIGRGSPAAPPLPDDLAPGYTTALAELRVVVAECARHPWELRQACWLAAALLVLNGQPQLGRFVASVPSHYPECPECGDAVFQTCKPAEPVAAPDPAT
jgi:hypothetical protein